MTQKDESFSVFLKEIAMYKNLSKEQELELGKLAANGDKKARTTLINTNLRYVVSEAKKLLGRPFRINGLVVEGKHNGYKLDFPTANLKLDYPYAFPKTGVYLGYAYVDDIKYKAIVSVGTHPTIMRLEKPIIEVHIIDFDGMIYGKDIFIEFIHYQRDEMIFASTDDLKEQLKKDRLSAIRRLKL